eukprot:1154492-Amphidinium_carterae.1
MNQFQYAVTVFESSESDLYRYSVAGHVLWQEKVVAMLQDNFKDATVIAVAHRLVTAPQESHHP